MDRLIAECKRASPTMILPFSRTLLCNSGPNGEQA